MTSKYSQTQITRNETEHNFFTPPHGRLPFGERERKTVYWQTKEKKRKINNRRVTSSTEKQNKKHVSNEGVEKKGWLDHSVNTRGVNNGRPLQAIFMVWQTEE
ncbi:hypothetical protein TNCV_3192751 [Trichonephila clavipes]|nr:hypothetical protein TNCV_3192751 [Trichonephila clavipes]